MRQLKLFRWAAVLMLAIALAPGTASAQEDGTLTISSTFTIDWLGGTFGDDLNGIMRDHLAGGDVWAASPILYYGRPGNAGWIESFPLQPLVTFEGSAEGRTRHFHE